MKKIIVTLVLSAVSISTFAGNGWCDRSKNQAERTRCYNDANARMHGEIQGYLDKLNSSNAPQSVKDEHFNRANATAKAIREQCGQDAVCVYNTAFTLKNNLLVVSSKYK